MGRCAADRPPQRAARLLVEAAFALFGDGGEAALSVRSVCRECGLNTRYFYESFADTDELLGAVYDGVCRLAARSDGAMWRPATRTGPDAGRYPAVLGFSSADPRRGRVLFTEARANPVLPSAAATQDRCGKPSSPKAGAHPDADPIAARVGAAMYTGAMAELAQQWLAGTSATTSTRSSTTPCRRCCGRGFLGRLLPCGHRGRFAWEARVEVPSYARQCR